MNYIMKKEGIDLVEKNRKQLLISCVLSPSITIVPLFYRMVVGHDGNEGSKITNII